MANIQISRLGCTILSDCISTTGKYYCFLGTHLVKGIPCYDVCGMARTGETRGVAIRKHFHDDKTSALLEWDSFQAGMTAPRGPSQEDEPEERMIIRDGDTTEEFIN